jgi:mannose PTS system EIIA component
MIGVIVISHGKLADELISAVNFVLSGKPSLKITPISMDQNSDFDTFKKDIKKSIKKADDGDGVLLVTDMFGGTPSNIGLTFLEDDKVEVISGVNLPMLLKLSTLSKDITLKQAVLSAEKAGKDNIIIASNLIKK